jgi:hypothetical protein
LRKKQTSPTPLLVKETLPTKKKEKERLRPKLTRRPKLLTALTKRRLDTSANEREKEERKKLIEAEK